MTTTSRGRKFRYNITNTHSYGKENRREHFRRSAQLNFCRSRLQIKQLMTSRSTTVWACVKCRMRKIDDGYFAE